jgi:hypothetical protein
VGGRRVPAIRGRRRPVFQAPGPGAGPRGLDKAPRQTGARTPVQRGGRSRPGVRKARAGRRRAAGAGLPPTATAKDGVTPLGRPRPTCAQSAHVVQPPCPRSGGGDRPCEACASPCVHGLEGCCASPQAAGLWPPTAWGYTTVRGGLASAAASGRCASLGPACRALPARMAGACPGQGWTWASAIDLPSGDPADDAADDSRPDRAACPHTIMLVAAQPCTGKAASSIQQTKARRTRTIYGV